MSQPEIGRLEAEALYHRQRVAIYRARAHGSIPTSETRMSQLKRLSTRADQRLAQARAIGGAS